MRMHRLPVVALIACGAVAMGLGLRTGRAKTSSDTPEVRTFRFTYSVAVVEIPEGGKSYPSGSRFRRRTAGRSYATWR